MTKEDCLYYEKCNDMGATIHWCQNYPHLNFDCDKCERYTEKNFVRVVRCKDCIFYHKYYDDSDYGACKLHQIDIDVCGKLDYCSHGERIEDEEAAR